MRTPEENKIKCKDYYGRNKEKCKAKSRSHYQKNKDAINAKRKEYFAKYREEHREKIRLDGKKYVYDDVKSAKRRQHYQTYKERDKPKNRKARLKKEYGITPEQYDEMLKCQDNRCAICERHQSEFKIRLAVDHCHHTGKVRGILCSDCNKSLGGFKDGVGMLNKATAYLQRESPLVKRVDNLDYSI